MNVAAALFDYHAAEADELSIAKGQEFTVLETYDDGWWLVKSASASVGLVPSNYLSHTGNDDDVAAAQQAELALPPGWRSAVDMDTHDTYYYNATSGQVQWDPPVPSSTSYPESSGSSSSGGANGEEAESKPPSQKVIAKDVRRLIDLREQADAKINALRTAVAASEFEQQSLHATHDPPPQHTRPEAAPAASQRQRSSDISINSNGKPPILTLRAQEVRRLD